MRLKIKQMFICMVIFKTVLNFDLYYSGLNLVLAQKLYFLNILITV